jgi:hypothetical protein
MAPQLGSDTYRSLGKSDGESERINNSIFSLVNEGISPLQTIKEKSSYLIKACLTMNMWENLMDFTTLKDG